MVEKRCENDIDDWANRWWFLHPLSSKAAVDVPYEVDIRVEEASHDTNDFFEAVALECRSCGRWGCAWKADSVNHRLLVLLRTFPLGALVELFELPLVELSLRTMSKTQVVFEVPGVLELEIGTFSMSDGILQKECGQMKQVMLEVS